MSNENLLPIGTLLQGGKYRIEASLASGGFGNTYRIQNVEFEEVQALKEFYLKGVNERDGDSKTVSVSNAENTPEFQNQKEKFRKEALRLRKIDNPHVVRVYDLFEENGTAYYVMDFLEGESLAARMKKQQHAYTEQEVISYTQQVIDALAAIHAENIWHLDLKPGNIMTDGDGRAVLIDFGASKQFHDADGRSLSTSTGLCYTPGYAPTEQIDGNINRMGPWTDLYALGATMYNMLTMKTPPSVSEIQDGEGFEFPDGVSVEMRRLIRWMMDPNRKRRPQTVAEVSRFLDSKIGASHASQPTAGEETVVTHGQSAPASVRPVRPVRPAVAPRVHAPSQPYPSKKSKLPWIIGGVVAAALLLMVVGGIVLAVVFGGNRSYDPEPSIALEEEVDDIDSIVYDEEMADTVAADPYDFDKAAEQPMEAQLKAEEQARAEAAAREERARAEEKAREDAAKLAEANLQAQKAEEEALKTVTPAKPVVEEKKEEGKVYDVVEQMPSFPGGDAALMSYLGQNIKYPVVAEENGIQGRVLCTFVVERDGSISDIKVVKSVDPSLDKEAKRVLSTMPRWNPGKQNGAAVRVKYTVPVTFRLQ